MSAHPTSTEQPRRTRRPGRPSGGGVVADRAQLLAAATELIDTHGPDVTMADIAAAATVTKPILYRTIGDRDALTSALSEILIDRVDAAIVAERRDATDPRSEFAAAVRGYLAAIDTDRNLFLFVNGGNQDTDMVRQLVDRSSRQPIELFTAARISANRDTAAARTWGHAIVGAFQFVALMWLHDDYSDVDTVADDLTQLLWPGVATAGD